QRRGRARALPRGRRQAGRQAADPRRRPARVGRPGEAGACGMNATAHQDELDLLATAWYPTAAESREAIRRAVMAAASEHGGLVHAATVREHLPPWVNPSQIGAQMCAWVRQ